MITITIQGATPGEVAAKLEGMFLQLSRAHDANSPAPEKVAAEKAPVKTKAAKPPNEGNKSTETPSSKVPPIEDVRAALMKLATDKGEDEVFKLLEKYKAKSASTVPEDKRADLIADVKKAVG